MQRFWIWLLMSGCAMAQGEQIYRCELASGQVHYQARACHQRNVVLQAELPYKTHRPVAGKRVNRKSRAARGASKKRKSKLKRTTKAKRRQLQKRCEHWRAKVRTISKQMKHGYTAAQGEKLTQQLARLRQYCKRYCEK